MSLINRIANLTAQELVAERTGRRAGGKGARVTRADALTHSAVWACLVLRADLISTMPVDVFRRVGDIQVEQAKPPVLVSPGGAALSWTQWCYATQFDLDSVGNTVGIITARDGLGLPAVIELVDITSVTFVGKGSKLTKVRVGSDEYDPKDVWHEKQYALAGSPIGLSPIAHAARAINGYLSAQEFADSWFSNSTVPGGHLKNTAKTLKKSESAAIKENFKATVTAGDVWVSGNDWEYSMLSAKASESSFIEERNFSISDVCRYLRVPGDMIDAEVTSGTITYANVTQRNLQLLIMNINPAIVRREDAWTRGLLPAPRYAKLNTNALQRMDLKGRYDSYKVGIDSEFLLVDEARDLENLPPIKVPESDKVAKAAEPLGALVRAGFDPESAASALGLPKIKHSGLVPITVVTPESREDTGQPSFHSHLNLAMDPAVVRVEVPPAEVTVQNRVEVPAAEPVQVNVEPTPVSVSVAAPDVVVHNRIDAAETPVVNVNVEPTPVAISAPVEVSVQPAEVVLNGPKRTKVDRDSKGDITGTTYEYDEE